MNLATVKFSCIGPITLAHKAAAVPLVPSTLLLGIILPDVSFVPASSPIYVAAT